MNSKPYSSKNCKYFDYDIVCTIVQAIEVVPLLFSGCVLY
jgi:hypothetical protein